MWAAQTVYLIPRRDVQQQLAAVQSAQADVRAERSQQEAEQQLLAQQRQQAAQQMQEAAEAHTQLLAQAKQARGRGILVSPTLSFCVVVLSLHH